MSTFSFSGISTPLATASSLRSILSLISMSHIPLVFLQYHWSSFSVPFAGVVPLFVLYTHCLSLANLLCFSINLAQYFCHRCQQISLQPLPHTRLYSLIFNWTLHIPHKCAKLSQTYPEQNLYFHDSLSFPYITKYLYLLPMYLRHNP
jgi:hypothetical protein